VADGWYTLFALTSRVNLSSQFAMLRFGTALLAAFALAASACHDPVSEQVVGAPPAPSAAKTGSANPQLRFQFEPTFVPFGGTAALESAIQADSPTSPYDNNVCGVFAVVNLTTTDGLLDPDGNYAGRSACGPRFLRMTVKFSGGTSIGVSDGAYITIGGLGAVDSTSRGRVGFQLSTAAISATGCNYVRYGYPGDIAGSDPALITRIGTTDAGKPIWEVESTGAHQPVCWPRSGSTRTLLAPMPFKIRIEELTPGQ
jgi:hypothetical protein